ncbi:MAG: LacI family DNA-binding transcriptional regulator [Pseudomonadota bacterium]
MTEPPSFLRKGAPAPTLDDVARAAGVSTATVSRALNSPKRVAEATRERVMSAVRQLDYTPNFSARAMASRASHTIGAVIPTMENAIFAKGIQAFEEELHARGYMLLVASSSYNPAREAEQVRALVSRGVDGILLIGHDRDPAVLKYLEARHTPAVAAWSFNPAGALPSVGFNNRIAMRFLAERVLSLGHVRLGMISGETARNDRARLRLQGVQDAMWHAGARPEELALIETTYGIEEGGDAFMELINRRPRPTAILCGNDVLAAGALVAARECGLVVPRDVSITGFDDIELAHLVQPSLTTVHVPHREMGQKAAATLVDMLEAGKQPVHLELETRLAIRASLAAV